jgi:predicted Zn-dependent peptidase
MIAAIEAVRNDKRAYAMNQMMRQMCSADSYGIPRLGKKEQVEEITAAQLWQHYQVILAQSPVEIFYVGSGDVELVARKFREMFGKIVRNYQPIPAQTPFRDGGGKNLEEVMEVTQTKLVMGFVTDITNRQPEFAAMQVLNALYGAGMTSKLFMQVREKMSLCYSIGSGYAGSKGIMTVSAGIDGDKEPVVRQEILNQLEECVRGNIRPEELAAAKEAILSGLRGIYDSPGAIEGYETTAVIGGFPLTVDQYRMAVEQVDVAQVMQAAKSLRLHTTYVLKGVEA